MILIFTVWCWIGVKPRHVFVFRYAVCHLFIAYSNINLQSAAKFKKKRFLLFTQETTLFDWRPSIYDANFLCLTLHMSNLDVLCNGCIRVDWVLFWQKIHWPFKNHVSTNSCFFVPIIHMQRTKVYMPVVRHKFVFIISFAFLFIQFFLFLVQRKIPYTQMKWSECFVRVVLCCTLPPNHMCVFWPFEFSIWSE